MSGALDLSDPKDQAMMRRYIRDRPKRFRGIDDEKKQGWLNDLQWAIEEGKRFTPGEHDDPLSGAKLVVSAIRTGVAMEQCNQRDEHHAEEVAAGKHDPTQQNVLIVNGVDVQRLMMPQKAREVASG